jgi:hypothetical protein
LEHRVKADANGRKRRAAAILVLIVGVVLFSCLGYEGIRHSEWGARQYLKLHREESEEFALACLAGEGADTYNGWDVDCYKENGQVEFWVSGFGLGSSTSYKGIYYSALDIPLGFQGAKVDFTADGDGWIWKEENGDNWQFTERIFENWFWFEAHF